MKEQKHPYKRLPGRGLKRGGSALVVSTRATLWLGKDHLLCRYRVVYTEEYKRFYFKDIQSFITTITYRGKIWNTVFLSFFSLVALLFFMKSTGSQEPSPVPYGIAGSIFLILFIINWLRGPTCTCHLRTAVSHEELPSLDRVKKAAKVINQLKPIIENVQGALNIEEGRKEAPDIPRPRQQAPASKPSGSSAASPPSSYSGWVHAVLFLCMILDAAFTAADMVLTSVAIIFPGSIAWLCIAIATPAALVKQSGQGANPLLKGMTWTAVGYLVLSLLSAYGIFFYMFTQNPMAAGNQWEMFKFLAAYPVMETPVLREIYFLIAGFSFLTGAIGLFALQRYRAIRSLSSPSSSTLPDQEF